LYFIGVDHHKQVSVMTVLDEDGAELKRGRVPNLRKYVKLFLEGFQPFTAVLETGYSSYVMADLLRELGGEVKIANAHQVKASPMPGSRRTSGTPGRWPIFYGRVSSQRSTNGRPGIVGRNE